MLDRSLSPVDWSRSAQEIHNQVWGLRPWPAAVTDVLGKTTKLIATRESGVATAKAPGAVVEAGKTGIGIACGDGTILYITELQAEGKKRMAAADYLRGNPVTVD